MSPHVHECPRCAGWKPTKAPAPMTEAELSVAFAPAAFMCSIHGEWYTLYNGRVAFRSDPSVQYAP